MKRTWILLICILAVILAGVTDSYLQKRERETTQIQSVFEKTETETEKQEEAAEPEEIRVLLKSGNFESEYHEELTVRSGQGFTMEYGDQIKRFAPESEVTITGESPEFEDDQVLYLKAEDDRFTLPKLERGREEQEYEGTLEIRRTGEGLLVINVLPLEAYLMGVVPSEMPSSYPMEALKAQAVCARTYARKQMEEKRAEEFFADVDDSVSYQVYNNQVHSEKTDEAVRETAGIVMEKDGTLTEALYYSTSCGMNMTADLSEEAVFAAFLSENNLKAYEAEEPWYRWQTDMILEQMGEVKELKVGQRSNLGRVEQLLVQREKDQDVIRGEYAVRKFMAAGCGSVTLQDGSRIENPGILPSAFFILNPIEEEGVLTGYHVYGGGYGHGNGMSQNGAKAMAEEGMSYQEILSAYYGDVKLRID